MITLAITFALFTAGLLTWFVRSEYKATEAHEARIDAICNKYLK